MDKIQVVDPTGIRRDPGAPRQYVTLLSSTGNIAQLTAPYFQVMPTLAITLVRKSDLLANGVNPSSPAAPGPGLSPGPVNIQPIFDVGAFVNGDLGAGGAVQMTYSFYDVDYGLLGSVVPDDIKTIIQSTLAAFTLPPVTASFSDLLKALGEDTGIVSNCGITCDPGQTLVALRVEFQREPDSVSQFQTFFTSGPTNRLQANWDWAMFADGRLLANQAVQTLKTALSNQTDFDLTAGPDGSWNGSAIDMSFRGTAENACKATDGDIDMKADLTVTTSVPSVNTLRTQLHLDVSSTNFFQVALCAATSALLWPFVGLLMTGTDDPLKDITEYIGLLVIHPLLRMITLVFAIESTGISQDLSSSLGKNWHKVDDDDYESDDTLDSTQLQLPGLGAQLEFDASVGAPDGLIFGGRVPMITYLAGSVNEVTSTPFSWRLSGNCQSFFAGANFATISVDANQPAKLCSATLVDTPAGDYIVTQNDDNVTVAPVLFSPGDINPTLPTEPCLVAVVTTDGVRIITFQPPVAETETEKDTLRKDGIIARGNCFKLTKIYNVIDKLPWVEQSVPDGYLQGWHVVVDNVHGQTVELQNEDGHSLVTAHATSRGIVQVVLLLDEAHAAKSLSIRLNGREPDGQATLNVSGQQILFALRSSVNAPDPLTQLSFLGASRDVRLTAASATQTTSWDLKTARLPRLRQSLAKTSSECRTVVHSGSGIGASLSAKAQLVLDSAWAKSHDYSIVGSPKVDGVEQTLYLGSKTRGTLWNISAPGKPAVLQVYHTEPWFAWTAASGKLIARRAAGSAKINIYEAVAEHQF